MTPNTCLASETQIHEGVAGCFLIVLVLTVSFHSLFNSRCDYSVTNLAFLKATFPGVKASESSSHFKKFKHQVLFKQYLALVVLLCSRKQFEDMTWNGR